EFEEFKKFIDQAEEEMCKNFEKKGFRKGQVPKEIVIKDIGQDKILGEAAQLAVQGYYIQAIKEKDLEPLGLPEIEILKLALNNPLEFKATIFVLPEIKLPDYKKISKQVKKQKIVIEDKEIETALKQVQEMKDKIPEEERKRMNFDKPEELKKTISVQMEKEKEVMERQRVRNDILSSIVKECDWDVPEILVVSEKRKAMENLKKNVSESLKISFEDYLKKVKKSEKELEDSLDSEIIDRIKKILVLGEIQKQEKIEARKEELEKEINAFLKHPANEKNKESIDHAALRAYLKERIEQEKTLQFLEDLTSKIIKP
ncbi:MAG: trigger factor, partial [Patescibacteria group bacterium]|nr:trigger factor [Patescibacteria group bacterium]